MTTLAEELSEIASQIAHEAGIYVLALISEEGSLAALRNNALRKSSATDLASDADHASEALIVRRLAELRPGDGILAEEGSASTSSTGVTWIIDPIDGTTNFLYGYGSFAISIAAEIDGVTVAGAVYDPLRQEIYLAAVGHGATCNGRPLVAAASATPLGEVLLGTGFHYIATRRRVQADLLRTILPAVRDIRRQGTASLDLCYVAAGRLDAYYEAELKAWDLAAGLLVAKEAGYRSLNLNLGRELENTLLVAHPDLLSTLNELLKDGATTRS
jgi:myo-inositol-1(or 4)-monophosphatase